MLHFISHQSSKQRARSNEVLLDLRKTPPFPDRILSATNCFSSFDVAMATSPSDKTVFARDNSLWERTILRKSSLGHCPHYPQVTGRSV